ncbi:D-2-hydroxyacid dehydrogenase [Microtetraspora niveoalba]|uniref:D-2-hydroxyacid dehydrogenase n=1 Tax=Microtetraspora niveoalba TaxID=46175 RepID=UPI000A078F86|nr:D-2-hydroxyacid dehydrogenase [Microtetraspora niveoalba]
MRQRPPVTKPSEPGPVSATGTPGHGGSRVVLTVLHADDPPPSRDLLRELAGEVRYARAQDLGDALPGSDALLLWDAFSPALRPVWHRADALRWIHVAAAGVDRLMFDELRASDVVVTNSRGVFDRPIAEYVLACVLAFAKDLPGSWRLQRARRWEHRVTERIDGRTAMIVGTGAIGREIARMLRAVGLTILGAGRTTREGDADFDAVYDSSRLAAVVGDVDYLVNVAPLTPETRGLIGADVFAALRPSARLINVGRGETVDTGALVEALRSGRLAGAALDVFEEEPLPAGHPLWSFPQVLISPHMSGDAAGWRGALADVFLDNLRRYATGAPLANVVDKRLGFVPSH